MAVTNDATSGKNDRNFTTEEQLQAAFFQAAINKYPVLRGYLFAVPNQKGTRHIREMTQLKAIGVTPGIPDHILYLNNGPAVGLEAKLPGGRQGPEQKVIEGKWARYHVYYTVEQAMIILESYIL